MQRNTLTLELQNRRAIRGICCLLIQGLEPATIGLDNELTDNLPQPVLTKTSLKNTKLPVIQHLFSHYCPTRAPGDKRKLHSVIQNLLNIMIPPHERERREALRAAAVSPVGNNDPAVYLLPVESFIEEGYILPSYPFDPASRVLDPQSSTAARDTHIQPFSRWQYREDGFIETPQPKTRQQISAQTPLRIIGIDCEMCKTTAGSEVARVSVVDGDGKLLFNSLVKPSNTVVDYATAFSGITKELLASVTTTLLDVQMELAKHIDYDTVLVGHSLNCDLEVLKVGRQDLRGNETDPCFQLVHPWVIDTSVIYHHTRGPPFKASLKWLASKWLQKDIQKRNSETLGHDSEEDARAAVELVKLKMSHGPLFGEFAGEQESIFDRLGQASPPRKSCIIESGRPSRWYAGKSTTAISAANDEAVSEAVIHNLANHDFVFARFAEPAQTLGWQMQQARGSIADAKNAAAAAPNGTDVEAKPAANDKETAASTSEEAYSNLNRRIAAIHAALPVNTALIILSGHRDPRTSILLNQKKYNFDDAARRNIPLSGMSPEAIWTEADDRALLSSIATVREGMSFFAIKR